MCVERPLRDSRSVAVFFLMIRGPPRSTLDRSSAASDVYKRQMLSHYGRACSTTGAEQNAQSLWPGMLNHWGGAKSVSYTHLRAHETVLDLVCRLLLEKKNETHHWRRRLTCSKTQLHIYSLMVQQLNEH